MYNMCDPPPSYVTLYSILKIALLTTPRPQKTPRPADRPRKLPWKRPLTPQGKIILLSFIIPSLYNMCGPPPPLMLPFILFLK